MAEVENLALILVNPCVLWMTKKKELRKKEGICLRAKFIITIIVILIIIKAAKF